MGVRHSRDSDTLRKTLQRRKTEKRRMAEVDASIERYLELLAAANSPAEIEAIEAQLDRIVNEMEVAGTGSGVSISAFDECTVSVQIIRVNNQGPLGNLMGSLFQGLRWLLGNP